MYTLSPRRRHKHTLAVLAYRLARQVRGCLAPVRRGDEVSAPRGGSGASSYRASIGIIVVRVADIAPGAAHDDKQEERGRAGPWIKAICTTRLVLPRLSCKKVGVKSKHCKAQGQATTSYACIFLSLNPEVNDGQAPRVALVAVSPRISTTGAPRGPSHLANVLCQLFSQRD